MLLFLLPSRPDPRSYHGTDSDGQKRRTCTQECTQVSPPTWRDPVSHNLLQGNGRLVGLLRPIIFPLCLMLIVYQGYMGPYVSFRSLSELDTAYLSDPPYANAGHWVWIWILGHRGGKAMAGAYINSMLF